MSRSGKGAGGSSQGPQTCLWPFSGSALTRAAIPLGLFLQKTPAAADQVHLTPDVVKRKRKRKEKTPPFLIPFGKSPGCQIHYIMSAQADTCVGAELDRVLAADRAWNVGLAAPGQRPRGRGTNFGLEGGASVCVGGEVGTVSWRGDFKGGSPITSRT